MTPRLTAETFCFAPAQTIASPSRVRWSSAVDSAIELACTQASPTSDKARAALSGLSRAAAWPLVPHSRTLERPTLGSVRSYLAPNVTTNVNVPYTHAATSL